MENIGVGVFGFLTLYIIYSLYYLFSLEKNKEGKSMYVIRNILLGIVFVVVFLAMATAKAIFKIWEMFELLFAPGVRTEAREYVKRNLGY